MPIKRSQIQYASITDRFWLLDEMLYWYIVFKLSNKGSVHYVHF